MEENSGKELIELCYAPAATLWRINHRWRRSTVPGFTLDLKRGSWAKRPGDEADQASDADNTQVLSGVRVLVRDTRNILLAKPLDNTEEDYLASLQYALQRGIEAIFQVEEQELASERIGEEAHRQILFWEAAEGGVGVLSRLVDDPAALARVARMALEICHFDPNTGEEKTDEVKDCGRACYRCLLSYSNQFDHALLNRHLVQGFLVQLARGVTKSEELSNNPDHFADLLSATTKPFARQVLEYLHQTGRRLPDLARPKLQEVAVIPDFFFKENTVCLVCGDSSIKPDLEDAGYTVVELNEEDPLEEQLKGLT